MSDFKFSISVLTGGSAPAVASLAHGLEDAHKGAKHAAEGVKLFEAEVGKLSGSVGGLKLNLSALSKGGHLFVFDLAEGMKTAYEITEKLVDKIIDMGKEIVGAVAHSEDLDFALKHMLGEEGFEKVEDMAEVFGKKTRYRAEQIKEMIVPLTKAGIKDTSELGAALAASLDIGAHDIRGRAATEDAIGALKRIYLSEKVNAKSLLPLGINASSFWEDFAQGTGKSVAQVKKLGAAGKLAGRDLFAAAVHQIKLKHDQKDLGEAAEGHAKTLGGALERLHSLPEDIFRKMIGTAGINNVHSAIDNVIHAVEKQAPAAIRIMDNVFSAVFSDLSGENGADKIGAAIGRLTEKIEGASKAFKEKWPSIAESIKTSAGVMWHLVEGMQVFTGLLLKIPGAKAWRGILGEKGVGFETPSSYVEPIIVGPEDRAREAREKFLREEQAAPKVVMNNNVTIEVKDSHEPPAEVARKYTQHMRDAHLLIQQELIGR